MTDHTTQHSEQLEQSASIVKDVADIERRVREAHARELEDAIEYRRRFFRWGVLITSMCIIASISILILLILHGDYETPVGVAFVSGLAVEVVGVVVVIAKYLFPNGGSHSTPISEVSISEENDT